LEGAPRPSRTAPLGMTKTPTLQVSADMLVSQSRALPPGPPLPQDWIAYTHVQEQNGVAGMGEEEEEEEKEGLYLQLETRVRRRGDGDE